MKAESCNSYPGEDFESFYSKMSTFSEVCSLIKFIIYRRTRLGIGSTGKLERGLLMKEQVHYGRTKYDITKSRTSSPGYDCYRVRFGEGGFGRRVFKGSCVDIFSIFQS